MVRILETIPEKTRIDANLFFEIGGVGYLQEQLAGYKYGIEYVEDIIQLCDFSKLKNPQAVKNTLTLILKDDMFFQSRGQNIREKFRTFLGHFSGREENRTQSAFNEKAVQALKLAESTGEIHTVVYNANEGYIVYGKNVLQKQAMSRPEETNTTLFKRLVSDTGYKDVLHNIFGKEGLEGISLYILSRGGKSKLIEGLPQEKVDFILGFGKKINDRLAKINHISLRNLPNTEALAKKLGRNIDIKFDDLGNFSFIETFGGQDFSPNELIQFSKSLEQDNKAMLESGRKDLRVATARLRTQSIKGYNDIQNFYKNKKAQSLELLKGLENTSIDTPLSRNELANLLLFLENNPSLKNEEVSKGLTRVIEFQLKIYGAASVIPQVRAVRVQVESNPQNAAKLALQVKNKDNNLKDRLEATGRIGEAKERQYQVHSAIKSDSDLSEVLNSLGLGDYDSIIHDPKKLTQALALLGSKSTPTIEEKRLFTLLQKTYQSQKEITEDIVTIRRSLPPEERRDTSIYVSAAFDKPVSHKEVEQYAYASRYYYGNEGKVGQLEQKISDMQVGTTMKLSGIILPPYEQNKAVEKTLSDVTLFAPEIGMRSIIYDGKVLATLPIAHIPGYIQSLSDLSYLGMNHLFPDMEYIFSILSQVTSKTTTGSDGDYSREESLRFLQMMNLICLGELPTISTDRTELTNALTKTQGTNIVTHFESLITKVQTSTGNPIWNTDTRKLHRGAFEEKMREVGSKMSQL